MFVPSFSIHAFEIKVAIAFARFAISRCGFIPFLPVFRDNVRSIRFALSYPKRTDRRPLTLTRLSLLTNSFRFHRPTSLLKKKPSRTAPLIGTNSWKPRRFPLLRQFSALLSPRNTGFCCLIMRDFSSLRLFLSFFLFVNCQFFFLWKFKCEVR